MPSNTTAPATTSATADKRAAAKAKAAATRAANKAKRDAAEAAKAAEAPALPDRADMLNYAYTIFTAMHAEHGNSIGIKPVSGPKAYKPQPVHRQAASNACTPRAAACVAIALQQHGAKLADGVTVSRFFEHDGARFVVSDGAIGRAITGGAITINNAENTITVRSAKRIRDALGDAKLRAIL